MRQGHGGIVGTHLGTDVVGAPPVGVAQGEAHDAPRALVDIGLAADQLGIGEVRPNGDDGNAAAVLRAARAQGKVVEGARAAVEGREDAVGEEVGGVDGEGVVALIEGVGSGDGGHDAALRHLLGVDEAVGAVVEAEGALAEVAVPAAAYALHTGRETRQDIAALRLPRVAHIDGGTEGREAAAYAVSQKIDAGHDAVGIGVGGLFGFGPGGPGISGASGKPGISGKAGNFGVGGCRVGGDDNA